MKNKNKNKSKSKSKYKKLVDTNYKTFDYENIEFRIRNLEETLYKLINLFDIQNKQLKELKKIIELNSIESKVK